MIRSIEVIGEATKKLPSEFTSRYPHVAWREMARSRDVLIHHYFGIDNDILWNTLKNDIPELHHQLKEIIQTEKKNNPSL